MYLPKHGFTPSPPPCWLRGRDWGRTAVRLSGGGRGVCRIGRFGLLLPLLVLLFPFSFAVAVGVALLVWEYSGISGIVNFVKFNFFTALSER